MLSVENLSLSYGKRPVLHGINLHARPGTVTAIVGPNGSGKSTALKAMTGELPYHGRITLEGHDISRTSPPALAAIRAVLSQFTPLSFPFTVLEVVRLGQTQGAAFNCDRTAAQALQQVGLDGYQGRYFQELSGGEQQRVQLARVLCQVWQPVAKDGPRWLFLDEPVSSLDIGHQLQIMQVARDFADAGGGVVAVMHDLNLTAMFADRVALFCEGRIMGFGATSDVLSDTTLSDAYGYVISVGTVPKDGVFVLPQMARLTG
ncbi:heme ABC transporter ATP-binding protein [Shimia biformata]|uniref:heme ABC transporter ATP-binding protein n=1 Tax=Shimia biformata TaxID=1294299 RepID=UPI0019525613|nr:heme ABC transporter ATP-binding protein [Shimia biformata]